MNIELTILQEEIEETLSLQKSSGYLDLRAFQGGWIGRVPLFGFE